MSNFTLNIIYHLLQHNHTDFLYYPLRACADYLLDDGQDCSLSNRLNSDTLISYKMKKEFRTNCFMDELSLQTATDDGSW